MLYGALSSYDSLGKFGEDERSQEIIKLRERIPHVGPLYKFF